MLKTGIKICLSYESTILVYIPPNIRISFCIKLVQFPSLQFMSAVSLRRCTNARARIWRDICKTSAAAHCFQVNG